MTPRKLRASSMPCSASPVPAASQVVARRSFPVVLYDMVSDQNLQNICGFSSDGKQFIVADAKLLCTVALRKHFGNANISSFSRLLRVHNFARNKPFSSKSDGVWVISHANFQRDQPDLLEKIVKVHSTSTQSSTKIGHRPFAPTRLNSPLHLVENNSDSIDVDEKARTRSSRVASVSASLALSSMVSGDDAGSIISEPPSRLTRKRDSSAPAPVFQREYSIETEGRLTSCELLRSEEHVLGEGTSSAQQSSLLLPIHHATASSSISFQRESTPVTPSLHLFSPTPFRHPLKPKSPACKSSDDPFLHPIRGLSTTRYHIKDLIGVPSPPTLAAQMQTISQTANESETKPWLKVAEDLQSHGRKANERWSDLDNKVDHAMTCIEALVQTVNQLNDKLSTHLASQPPPMILTDDLATRIRANYEPLPVQPFAFASAADQRSALQPILHNTDMCITTEAEFDRGPFSAFYNAAADMPLLTDTRLLSPELRPTTSYSQPNTLYSITEDQIMQPWPGPNFSPGQLARAEPSVFWNQSPQH